MGFFKKLGRVLNPVDQAKQIVKDPKQALKNASSMGIDPAGSVVRAGTTGDMAPVNARAMIDPSGKVLAPEATPTTQTPYTPRPLQLSPGAQALYDDMKARSAARAAGQAYAPPAATPPPAYRPTPGGGVQPIMQVGASTPQMSTPLQAPKPQPITPAMPAAPAVGVPARAQSYKGISGVPMADGGKVKDDTHFESKAFERKPNGKPY